MSSFLQGQEFSSLYLRLFLYTFSTETLPISVDRYSLFRFDYVPLISLLHRLRGTFTFISSCNMLDVHMRFPAVEEPEVEDEEEKEEAHDPGVK